MTGNPEQPPRIPPLAENEAYYIEYQGDGQYQFVFYISDLGDSPQPVFSVTVSLPVGSVGITEEPSAEPTRGVTEEDGDG